MRGWLCCIALALSSASQANPQGEVNAEALLDGALVACYQGGGEEAEERLRGLLRLDPPPGVRGLIAGILRRGCARRYSEPETHFSRWISQVTLGVGHASNVNSAPKDGIILFPESSPIRSLELSPEERPIQDTFLTTAILTGWRPDEFHGALRTSLQITSRSHFEVKGSDQTSLNLGMEWGRLGLDASRADFGPDFKENGIHLRWVEEWTNGLHGLLFRAALSRIVVEADTRRASLRPLFELRYRRSCASECQLQLGAELGVDLLKNGTRVGGNRGLGSLSIQLGLPLTRAARQSIELFVSRQTEREPFNPLFFGDERRVADRFGFEWTAHTTKPLFELGGGWWTAFLKLRQEWQDDRISLFKQDAGVVLLGFSTTQP